MKALDTPIPGVIILEPAVFADARGCFLETYHATKYADVGIRGPFVQDNWSVSSRGVLRGLHYQRTRSQGKLVYVVSGEIFDVAVDIRNGSPTFGGWFGLVLSADNKRQLYIPPGFAHGFSVMSERASVIYKCTDLYAPDDEGGIRWNDPRLAIDWPVREPLLSAKDQGYPALADVATDALPAYRA